MSNTNALLIRVQEIIGAAEEWTGHKPTEYTVSAVEVERGRVVSVSGKAYPVLALREAIEGLKSAKKELFVLPDKKGSLAVDFVRTWGLTSLVYADHIKTLRAVAVSSADELGVTAMSEAPTAESTQKEQSDQAKDLLK